MVFFCGLALAGLASAAAVAKAEIVFIGYTKIAHLNGRFNLKLNGFSIHLPEKTN
jgi:hypothetical protein